MICVDNLYTRGPREKKSLKRSCAVPHCTEKTLESLHGKKHESSQPLQPHTTWRRIMNRPSLRVQCASEQCPAWQPQRAKPCRQYSCMSFGLAHVYVTLYPVVSCGSNIGIRLVLLLASHEFRKAFGRDQRDHMLP